MEGGDSCFHLTALNRIVGNHFRVDFDSEMS